MCLWFVYRNCGGDGKVKVRVFKFFNWVKYSMLVGFFF